MKKNFLFPILIISFLFSNCLSLKPPAITFTQTQTAAEVQLIGEGKELEKDGWLISSIQTSSSGSDNWKKESNDQNADSPIGKELLINLKLLSYLSPEIKEFKSDGVIGETLDGQIQKNPMFTHLNQDKKYQSNETQLQIENLLKKTNSIRTKIIDLKIQINTKELESKISNTELKNQIIKLFYKSVLPGEYFEVAKNKWQKKD